jgi:hypothetical protein
MQSTNMLEASSPIAPKPAKARVARNRVTNGTTLLPTVDGRSGWARLMRDTYHAVISHCGGDSAISELERMAARRIGALEAELVYLEDKFASIRAAGGEPAADTLDLYSRVSNTHRRCCESIGWRRRSRNITPMTLSQYVELKTAEKAAADQSRGPISTGAGGTAALALATPEVLPNPVASGSRPAEPLINPISSD